MQGIRDSIQALSYVQRQQGWRAALGMAGQFLQAPFFEFHSSYVLRKSLREPIQVPEPEVAVSIRPVGPEDLALLETIVPPLRAKRLAKKMQAGEIGCVAVKHERVIAYVLAGFAGTPSTRDTRLELSPGEAYLWAGYALPEYRRQRVVKAVNLYLCRLLREKGFETVVLLVDRANEASLGHCQKMGYRVTDRRTSLRFLQWRWNRQESLELGGKVASCTEDVMP